MKINEKNILIDKFDCIKNKMDKTFLILNTVINKIEILNKDCIEYVTVLKLCNKDVFLELDYDKLKGVVNVFNEIVLNITNEARRIVDGSISINMFNKNIELNDKFLDIKLIYDNNERKIYVSLFSNTKLLIESISWNEFKYLIQKLESIINNWILYQISEVGFNSSSIEEEKAFVNVETVSHIPDNENPNISKTIVDETCLSDNSTINYNNITNKSNEFLNLLDGYEGDELQICEDNDEDLNSKTGLRNPLDLF